MQTNNVTFEAQPYHAEHIYICQYPATHAEIKKVAAGTRIQPLTISGVTFDICKEGVRIIAESRVKSLEKQLEFAKQHLSNVLALKESDVK